MHVFFILSFPHNNTSPVHSIFSPFFFTLTETTPAPSNRAVSRLFPTRTPFHKSLFQEWNLYSLTFVCPYPSPCGFQLPPPLDHRNPPPLSQAIGTQLVAMSVHLPVQTYFFCCHKPIRLALYFSLPFVSFLFLFS